VVFGDGTVGVLKPITGGSFQNASLKGISDDVALVSHDSGLERVAIDALPEPVRSAWKLPNEQELLTIRADMETRRKAAEARMVAAKEEADARMNAAREAAAAKRKADEAYAAAQRAKGLFKLDGKWLTLAEFKSTWGKVIEARERYAYLVAAENVLGLRGLYALEMSPDAPAADRMRTAIEALSVASTKDEMLSAQRKIHEAGEEMGTVRSATQGKTITEILGNVSKETAQSFLQLATTQSLARNRDVFRRFGRGMRGEDGDLATREGYKDITETMFAAFPAYLQEEIAEAYGEGNLDNILEEHDAVLRRVGSSADKLSRQIRGTYNAKEFSAITRANKAVSLMEDDIDDHVAKYDEAEFLRAWNQLLSKQ
jgi:hypothetical protein